MGAPASDAQTLLPGAAGRDICCGHRSWPLLPGLQSEAMPGEPAVMQAHRRFGHVCLSPACMVCCALPTGGFHSSSLHAVQLDSNSVRLSQATLLPCFALFWLESACRPRHAFKSSFPLHLCALMWAASQQQTSVITLSAGHD